MWICLPNGFFSVVQNNLDGKKLMVRSRIREHITHYFPDYEIFENVGTDYQYRIFIERKDFSRWIANESEHIQYTNFKNAVKDYTLHNFYSEIWNLGWNLLKKPIKNTFKNSFDWLQSKSLKNNYDYLAK